MKEGLERVLRDQDNKDELRPVSLAFPLTNGNGERTHSEYLQFLLLVLKWDLPSETAARKTTGSEGLRAINRRKLNVARLVAEMKEGLERVLRDQDNKDELRPVSLAFPLTNGNGERTHVSPIED
ncbi:hypothetical protein NDU88_006356 [Pleurodeles waltl]|uniref:Uncharacterized protein n=1 Tax=Pleurodeles waltl TaxID=8319 RepID=A0AAV7VMJ5_PLEWA|nr:hypothetical protein NDU88_006356 [Pleurodeles waltl]